MPFQKQALWPRIVRCYRNTFHPRRDHEKILRTERKFHPESVVGTCFLRSIQGTKTIQVNSAGRTAAIPLKAAHSDWGSLLGRIAFKYVSALGAASVWNTWQSVFKSGSLACPQISSIQYVRLCFCIFCGPLRGKRMPWQMLNHQK